MFYIVYFDFNYRLINNLIYKRYNNICFDRLTFSMLIK